jgi:uncharacterized protein (DUF2147 family)
MKNIHSGVIVAMVLILGSAKVSVAQSANPDAIIGVFQNKDGAGKIEVYQDNLLYFGKTALTGDGVPAGTIVFKNLKFSAGKWIGKVYAVKRKQDFDCVFTLDNAGDLHLDIKAGIMSRKQIWARLK